MPIHARAHNPTGEVCNIFDLTFSHTQTPQVRFAIEVWQILCFSASIQVPCPSLCPTLYLFLSSRPLTLISFLQESLQLAMGMCGQVNDVSVGGVGMIQCLCFRAGNACEAAKKIKRKRDVQGWMARSNEPVVRYEGDEVS